MKFTRRFPQIARESEIDSVQFRYLELLRRNEVKKITKLVDEVTSLLMKSGSNDINVHIKRDVDLTTITIIDHNTSYPDDEIASLDDVLNIQRQSEVEEFYWELMGDDLHGDELFLVGSMVDRATVKKIDNDLHVIIYREVLTKSKK